MVFPGAFRGGCNRLIRALPMRDDGFRTMHDVKSKTVARPSQPI